MTPEVGRETSPIVAIFHELRALNPKWYVEMGRPHGPGWITGSDFLTATEGPFEALLNRIGEQLQTSDRRTIAASFALRYGWSSAVAIAPYLLHHCVPKITLDNVSFKFHATTSFERAALHRPEGVMLLRDGVTPHPSMQWLSSPPALLGCLRASLMQQAQPVVDALYKWSHFSMRGIWGMLTSAWASQFINIFGAIDEQKNGLPRVQQFFQGNDVVSQMQPHLYPVTFGHVTHVYHRASSCCRYYLLRQGQYCASCPLVSQEDRLQRNRQWMKHLLESQ
jgi:hypothetical protein